MPARGRLELRQYVRAGTILFGAVMVGGTLFVLSGLYNVSAARDHLGITTWLLELVRTQSVRAHSLLIDAPPLGDETQIRLGAGHYEAGCAPCHGAPGREPSALSNAMLPKPPPLYAAVRNWSASELFWIVKHGQKYTGMPAWISQDRDDEVWPVVAFLQTLPDLDAAGYAALSGLREGSVADAFAIRNASMQDVLDDCIRCHADVGELPRSRLVPALSGLSRAYLGRALDEYASGVRESGIMQLAVGALTADERDALAAHYSEGPDVAFEGASDRPELLERGERIVNSGLPEAKVPPCVSCHRGVRRDIPDLAGQSARYIELQLHLWRKGLRDHSAYGAIMSRVANRLPENDIEAVAAYLENLGRSRVQEAAR